MLLRERYRTNILRHRIAILIELGGIVSFVLALTLKTVDLYVLTMLSVFISEIVFSHLKNLDDDAKNEDKDITLKINKMFDDFVTSGLLLLIVTCLAPLAILARLIMWPMAYHALDNPESYVNPDSGGERLIGRIDKDGNIYKRD